MYPKEQVLAEYCLSPDLDIKADIYLPQMRLAVEVNGQTHYIAGSDQLTARSVFRTGLVQDLGLKALSINHRDWSALKGLQSKKEHFASLLASCLAERSEGIS